MVTQVIVVSNDDTSDSNGVESESIGVAFCQKLLGADTNWKQTSYNGNMRVRYAEIGYTYIQCCQSDYRTTEFVIPQPYAVPGRLPPGNDFGYHHLVHAPTLTDDQRWQQVLITLGTNQHIKQYSTTGWTLTTVNNQGGFKTLLFYWHK